MKLAPRIPLAALCLALAVAGCGGCTKKEEAAPASPLRFLSQLPHGVVHVPDLREVGRTIAALEETKLAELAAAAAGAKDPEAIVRPLVRQLGFDPRTPEGFAEAGIDPAKGIAIGQEEDGAQLLIIGVADGTKFEAYVAGLVRRFRATTRGEAEWKPEEPGAAAVKITTYAAPEGPIHAAYAVRGGYAVIGQGAGAVDAVGRAIARPRERSLDHSPIYRKVQGKLGARAITAWMPRGLPGRTPREKNRFEHGLALGFSASAKGVNVRALIPQGPLALAVIQPAGKVAGLELAKRLSDGDFLALRIGGEPLALKPLLESALPRGMFARLKRAGIDPELDVLGNLHPGVAIGLSLNPGIDLSGGLPQDASISRTNPFRFVNAVVYAKVKDPAKAAAVLEKLAAGAEHFRMQVATSEVEGAKLYQASYAAGDGMRWGLVGDTLIATGGKVSFADAKARLAAEKPGFLVADPSAKKVFETTASAAHLDMPKLAASLRAIPEEAYGIGGFRLKAIMDTWVELLGEVKGITASFSVDDEGIVVDADLGLK